MKTLNFDVISKESKGKRGVAERAILALGATVDTIPSRLPVANLSIQLTDADTGEVLETVALDSRDVSYPFSSGTIGYFSNKAVVLGGQKFSTGFRLSLDGRIPAAETIAAKMAEIEAEDKGKK